MPVTLGPERLVNTVTDGAQRAGEGAEGAHTIATIWLDESGGSAVAKLRIFDTFGGPQSGEIVVGAATDVAMTTFGDGFVVVRTVQTGRQQAEVTAQVYSATGVAIGGPLVLDTTDVRNTPILESRPYDLEIIPLSDGGYIVGWSNQSGDSSGRVSLSGEYAVVSAQGAIEGHETVVSVSGRAVSGAIGLTFTEAPGGQILANYRLPAVALEGPPSTGQFVQVLDLAGAKQGLPTRIDFNMPHDGAPPITSDSGMTVAALPNGKVVYAWIAQGSVYVSLVPANQLDQAGRTTAVSLGTSSGVGEPDVIVLRDGSFVVGFSANEDVWGQQFSATGQLVGERFKIGTVSLGVQEDLHLALGPSGTVVALWQDPSGQTGAGGGADPSGLGIKLEVLALDSGQSGGPGADTLFGSQGPDLLIGNAGDDALNGGGGADTLLGGGGGDVLVGGAGEDLLDGGSSGDFLNYNSASAGLIVDLVAQRTTGGDNDVLRSIEHVFGSEYDDLLRGNHLSNLLSGATGADTIEGQSGSNYIDGGSGNDLLVLVGSVTDYFVTPRTGQPALVSGPFGVDQVIRMERVSVGGTEMSWDDFTSRAFNGLRYVASNPDLIASIGTNVEAAKQHWTSTGQAQGRSLDSFDPLRYAASNPDLQAQFYIDTAGLTRHYITTGFAAHRPTDTFDALMYGASNNDLLLAFGADASALTRHYVVSGVAEHRPTTGFNALDYGAANDDLARVFGTDANALFNHWINSGVYEGRAPAGFDAVGYLLSYPELAAAGVTPQTAQTHWLTTGADLGLRGDELFGREQTSHAIGFGVTKGELKNVTTSGRSAADRDWYEITLSGSQTVRLSAQGADSGHGTLADPRIEIYDSFGHLVASDEDGGVGRDALFSLVNGGPPATQTKYYMVVRSEAGAEGTYDLSVESVTFQPAAPAEGWMVW